jgi:hypothetical protein
VCKLGGVRRGRRRTRREFQSSHRCIDLSSPGRVGSADR